MPKLRHGELAPGFQARTPSNPRYAFHTAAGRPILLVFLGRPAGAAAARLVEEVGELRSAFNDRDLALFYVVNDEQAIQRLGISQALPGIRCFLDFDGRIAAQLGFSTTEGASGSGLIETGAVLLDRALRGLETVVVADDDNRPVIAPLIEQVRSLAAWEASAPNLNHAPVLVAERIFEPAFCRALIEYFERHGGDDSGFMRERDGLTVMELDHQFKRRTDCSIDDERIRGAANARVSGLLRPLLHRAFQFNATRIERHLVCRYDSIHRGFFGPHRDNTTKGTAHRRFAVTINLNADGYEGGDLRFPEFGPQAYRAPTGGAIVFSCSLLHEALPVTAGTRYAYLPFLYGEEDATLRERNRVFVADQTLRD